MLKLMKNLPPDVLGVEAAGKVTHEDYRDVLIPAAERMMKKGPIAMLYVIGPEFSGFDAGAMWDDAAFGLKHWREFSRIAVVTDVAWIKGAASMFMPLFPCAVRIFAVAEMEKARAWIAGTGQQNGAV